MLLLAFPWTPWARMRHGQARRPCLFVRGVFVCCLRPVGFTVDHSPDSGHVDDAPISAYHAGSQIPSLPINLVRLILVHFSPAPMACGRKTLVAEQC